jgi:DNA-binding transcriptional ArsR family regulator
MSKNRYGVNTEEADNEVYDAAEEFTEQQESEDWSTEKLLGKYENLRKVTLENIPNLWIGLEFALSVKSILNIKDCTLPFAGILLGPPSSLKTLIIECFRGYKHTYYTDDFSARSFVSHITGKTEDQLRRDDLLPKMKNKLFMTPELAPTFSAREEDLLQKLGIITRVVDGQGYESDSGACGHRGYDEDIMFAWIGAAVDIPYRVHKMLAYLGPKLHFFRLDRILESENDYFKRRNESFTKKREAIRTALHEYLAYFDMNPEAEINIQKEEDGLPKIALDPEKDEELAHRVIIRVAKLLAHLRALVPTWETRDTQGSQYAYALAIIEDPSRAMTQLRNLAKGHALSRGRKYITIEDIPTVIHTALSTATMERVRIFELLIANKGRLTTTEIVEFLNTSPPTARRTMTELKATGLVHMDDGEGQVPSTIRLKPEFHWFLTRQFAELKEQKEKYPPQEGISLSVPLPIVLYDSTINRKILSALHHTDPFCGGGNSFYKSQESLKPLEEWTYADFRSNGCIWCINNGGYHGPLPLTTDEYERHIVMKHKNRPAYPGPADIEKYGLKLNGKSKLAEVVEANESGKNQL